MKRLAFWGAVCIGAVVVQMAVTFWFLVPHIDDRAYVIRWWSGDVIVDATGWYALMPYHAWPILVTYLGALVMVGSVIALAIARLIVLRERKAIAEREAAAAAQVQEAERILTQAREIERAAEDQVQAAVIQASRHKQEAAAQVEEAEFRLQRSVNTNIGLRRQIQELKKRVNEQGEQGTMDSC